MVDADCEAGTSTADTARPFKKLNVPKTLNPLEKRYFLAVERGNLSLVRSILGDCDHRSSFDINCVDALGRSTLLIAIENENLEMVRLLLDKGVEIRDALLHAIDKEFVECAEFLLDYEERHHKEGEPYSWEKLDSSMSTFMPEITPLILAGHRNNYEILKLLLDRGATLPVPHDVRCSCQECVAGSQVDSLRHSRRRYNAYKALASPSLIALSSTDPILTAFELSWELKNLSFAENEYKQDYLDLRSKCQDFAMDLLAQARSSSELEILLNHDPMEPPHQLGDHMSLARLKVAIAHKQKKFVAHPNVQQLLTSLWYEGLPGFRRKSPLKQILEVIIIIALFPFLSVTYMVCPTGKIGKLMRKPFMKFLIHSASYLFFLLYWLTFLRWTYISSQKIDINDVIWIIQTKPSCLMAFMLVDKMVYYDWLD